MTSTGGGGTPERAVGGAPVRYELTLFIAGASDRSARAIAHASALGEAHLAGVFELRILDLLVDIEEVRIHGVLAAPTLIKLEPPPERRFVGDLADSARVLAALGVGPADPVEARG